MVVIQCQVEDKSIIVVNKCNKKIFSLDIYDNNNIPFCATKKFECHRTFQTVSKISQSLSACHGRTLSFSWVCHIYFVIFFPFS